MVWMPEEGEYFCGKPCLEAYNASGVRSEGALPLRQRIDSPEEPPGPGWRRQGGWRRGRQLVKGRKRGRQAHPAAAPIKYEHKAEDCL